MCYLAARILEPSRCIRMSESAGSTSSDDRLLLPAAEVDAEVACVYCHAAIPSREFDFTSPTRRLVCTTCLTCRRTVTLPTAVWRRETARTLRMRA